MKLLEAKTWGRVAWGLSGVLWLLLLLGALTYQREGLRLLPDEATVLMQAQSLVEDGDFKYERLDFDRILLQIAEPPDLDLTSATGGRRITFDRPFPYALWLAPFVAWRPVTGFAVANVLLLAASGLWVSWALARRSGPFGPAWVTALVFASPVLTSVFRVDGDAFVVSTVFAAVGFALHAGGAAGLESRSDSRYALLAGFCLALAGAWDFLWLVLPFAFLLLWHQGSRRLSLLGGFLLGALPQMLVQWWVGGGLHFFGGTRGHFTTATGFPYVDFPPLEWGDTVHRLSALYFDGAPVLSWGFDLLLWLWNGVFLLFGRHLGVLPYAAVVVVALFAVARSGEDERLRGVSTPGFWTLGVWTPGLRTWLAASFAAVLVLLIFRPFQLFDAAALGPTPLLPLLALAPLVRASAPRGAQAPLLATWALLACLVLSVPGLLPLWQAPRATADDRLVPGGFAASYLPYETSQQDLAGGPWEDVAGLRVRFLDGHGWGESRRDRLVMEGDQTARLLVASLEPLDGLVLDFGDEASTRLEVAGGELKEVLLRPSGGVGFSIALGGGRRHVMWWSPSPRWLYFLSLSFTPPDADADAEKAPATPLPFRVGVVTKASTDFSTPDSNGDGT